MLFKTLSASPRASSQSDAEFGVHEPASVPVQELGAIDQCPGDIDCRVTFGAGGLHVLRDDPSLLVRRQAGENRQVNRIHDLAGS